MIQIFKSDYWRVRLKAREERFVASMLLIPFVISAVLVSLFTYWQFARLPISELVGYVADDAFYYLKIAQNIAKTGYSSFDGDTPTNGYHPLWIIMLLPLALVAKTPEGLLRASVALCGLLHIASAYFVFRIAARWLHTAFAIVVAIGWLLSNFVLRLSLIGVETMLLWLMLFIVLLRTIELIEQVRANAKLSTRNAVSFGCLLGLLMLARTDQAITAATVLIALGVASSNAGMVRREWLSRLGIVVGVATAVLVPWFLYSFLTVGSIAQDSGALKMYWHALEMEGKTTSDNVVWMFSYTASTWFGVSIQEMYHHSFPSARSAPFILALIVMLFILFVRRRVTLSKFLPLAALPMAALVLGLVYGLTIADRQPWHLALPVATVFLIPSIALFQVLDVRLPEFLMKPVAVVIVTAMTMNAVVEVSRMKPTAPWQTAVFESQREFEEKVAGEAVIGAFNAGIPGFFSDRRIINLDGLVNHEAAQAQMEHRMDSYLQSAGIDYIFDEWIALERAERSMRRSLAVRAIDSADLPGWLSGRRYLWRVEKAE